MSLSIEQLTVTRSGREIIRIEQLTLPSQGAIALIGPNGAGKSTLLRTMAGIESGNHGQVSLHQQPLHQLSGRQRARQIGFIPQSFTPCWNQRVDELMALSAERAMLTAQAQTQLFEQFELVPLLTHHWDTLSGGERARVLLAMALSGDPPVLLADEPGAALDIRHRLEIIHTLSQRGSSQLVIVCLHELDLVFRYFDQVLLLENGRISFYGNATQLLHSPLLDQAFGVTFERLNAGDGKPLLYARDAEGKIS